MFKAPRNPSIKGSLNPKQTLQSFIPNSRQLAFRGLGKLPRVWGLGPSGLQGFTGVSGLGLELRV